MTAESYPTSSDAKPFGAPSRVSGSTTRRIDSLDGLRGLAALTVLLAHATGALGKSLAAIIALHHSPIVILANGGGGVHIFFVLSGFCLAGPARRSLGTLRIVQFYLRRILRIYPPYVAGLLLAWGLSGTFYDRGGESDALSHFLIELRRVHLPPEYLRRALLFPGDAFNQIPVGWTLRIEMIFSFLLPPLIAISLRAHWLVIFAASVLGLVFDFGDWTFQRFAIDFSLGIAIYLERDRLSALFGRFHSLVNTALIFSGLLILSSPRYFMLDDSYPKTSIVLYVGGAVILVAGAIHVDGFRRLLALPLIRWMGRISYSVYLIHIPIIVLLTPYVQERLNFWEGALFVTTCISATYIVAPLFYYFIEVPSIQLGYDATRWLGSRHSGEEPHRPISA